MVEKLNYLLDNFDEYSNDELKEMFTLFKGGIISLTLVYKPKRQSEKDLMEFVKFQNELILKLLDRCKKD